MSYDFDDNDLERKPPLMTNAPVWRGDDLEAIVTLIVLAAIYLTPSPDTKFTFEQLIEQARLVGGDEIHLDENAVRVVLPNLRCLKKCPKNLYSLR